METTSILLILGIFVVIRIKRYREEKQAWNNGICKETGTPWEPNFDRGKGYAASHARPIRRRNGFEPEKQISSWFGRCTAYDGQNYYLWASTYSAQRTIGFGLVNFMEHITNNYSTRVTVTSKHIRDCPRGDSTQCALATALSQSSLTSSRNVEFVVMENAIYFIGFLSGTPEMKFLDARTPLENELQEWVSDYDVGKAVKPIQVQFLPHRTTDGNTWMTTADVCSKGQDELIDNNRR